jgi:dihydrolipoamide dehydrogenase
MKKHDLVVIGAGPGGYVAAIRAAQLGMDVAVIDENEQLGGTCLRVGCIPSKAMLESSELYAQAAAGFAEHGVKVGKVSLDLPAMLARKEKVVSALTSGIASLLKTNKVHHYHGRGTLSGPGKVVCKGLETFDVHARHIVIATGSLPAALPGIEFHGKHVHSSTEALSYDTPPSHLVVIGAGYIGLEMGSVWSRLGSKVTVLEYLDRILPGMDAEIAAEARKLLEKQGLEFQLGSKVTAVKVEDDLSVVVRDGGDPIRGDRVLMAVGRRPNTAKLGLESVQIQTDGRGFIPVNERYETSCPGLHAIGDVIGGAMLAHKAEEEGIACVEWIATGYGHVNYDAIPAVVYTHPEIASVGKTEEQLTEAGVKFRKGLFPFRANGRARTLGQIEGKVKILADAQTDRVLGVHILGNRAGDMIAEAAAAIEFGATAEDIARTSHAHPTLSEAVKEAALAVDQRPIHI